MIHRPLMRSRLGVFLEVGAKAFLTDPVPRSGIAKGAVLSPHHLERELLAAVGIEAPLGCRLASFPGSWVTTSRRARQAALCAASDATGIFLFVVSFAL